jgi:hypothetical protein
MPETKPHAAAVRAVSEYYRPGSEDTLALQVSRAYRPLVEAAQTRVDYCQSCHGDGRSAIPWVPCPICLGLRTALREVVGDD